MFRRLAGILAVCGVTCLGQSPDEARTTEFQKSVLPVLSARCLGCHSSQLKSGNLNLEQFRNASLAPQQIEIWKKVRDRLTAGTMPPPPAASLSKVESAAVVGWIDQIAGRPASGAIDPGRVTARRLNRVEYDNTTRDLLGVNLRTAAEFPTDDSGYGFDNIGDVLSLSPLLMEKLMSAARRISQAAVFGESYPSEPGLLVKIKPKRSQDDSPPSADIFPYSMRGALYGTYHFPVDGQYEFRWRYANFRGPEVPDQPAGAGSTAGRKGGGAGRGALTPEQRKALDERNRLLGPPVQMVFTIDGRQVLTAVVEGSTDYNYARGETVVRVPVTAGDHFLRASFPELANLDDPRVHINRDGRRKIFVDYMDIVGPYEPSHAPAPSYTRIFICGHAPGRHNAQCARRVVENLAHRAYRRPPSERELEPLLRLVALAQKQGDSLEEGVRVSLQAMLMSPNFLFRIERDPAGVAPGAVYRTSDLALASRLSFFLWSSIPDDELLVTAERGELHKPKVLEKQVRRMLADSRALNLVRNFGEQWLHLRNLESSTPDLRLFPDFDDNLRQAFRRETELHFETLLREDRSVLDLLKADYTFLNERLAKHYGIPNVYGSQFRRVALDKNSERGGLLRQGSILTVTSYATRTSPVIRGKWVLENIVGAPPPPPLPDVPALKDNTVSANLSVRARLAEHRANAACASCHNLMDPVGFALENYDAIGRWRTLEEGQPVDATGGLPDGSKFVGVGPLEDGLRKRPELFVGTLTEKLLTFALGRGVEPYDAPAVRKIVQEAKADDYRFSSIIVGITKSTPFTMRKAL